MNRSAAFTIVELLVALTITVILVLLLTSVVAATLGVWSQGRNRLDTYSNARQIMQRLGDELKGALARNYGADQIQFVENSGLGAVPAPTPAAAENVFFVAPYPNSGAGDLCTIAYALDSTTHELKRAFRSSDAAWTDGAGKRYQASGYNYVANDWRVIAKGVLEFELQCYSQDNLDHDNPPAVTWDSESADPTMVAQAPRRVLLRLKVVDDKSAVQLAGLTSGSAPYNAILLRSAREFTSGITLPPPR
jgi:type II secretory pathway pseudopilin PulG